MVLQCDTETIIIIMAIITVYIIMTKKENTERFYYKNPPVAYDINACGRMCDNTKGCNSYYYDASTRKCWMNGAYRNEELYYPNINNTYWWNPSRYRWGRYNTEATQPRLDLD